MEPPRMHTNMTHPTLTPQERRQTIELLHSTHCSCVILKDGKPRLFRERGVKDLYRLLTTEPSSLAGAFVADKVVGKAAAALLILGGVGELHADVISRPALDLLQKAGVAVGCTLEVPRIINRTRTGWCPLETRCDGLTTPGECLAEIERFLNETSAGK